MNDKLPRETRSYFVREPLDATLGREVISDNVYRAALVWFVDKYGAECEGKGDTIYVWKEGEGWKDAVAFYVRVEKGVFEIAAVKFPVGMSDVEEELWMAGAHITNDLKIKPGDALGKFA